MKEYKIVIMGGGGVGKSALTVQFVHDMFVERYDPTIEDSYRKILMVDGNRVTVEILDTAGTEQFMALHSLYVRSGDGFLLVFALNAPDSLHELEALHESILRIKDAERAFSDEGERGFGRSKSRRTAGGGGAGAGGLGAGAGGLGGGGGRDGTREGAEEKGRRGGSARGSGSVSEGGMQVPIVLCGNKSDLAGERMVQRQWAVEMSKAWGEVPYYETSARKRIGVDDVFLDLVRQIIKADAASGGMLGTGVGGGGSSEGGRRRGRRKRAFGGGGGGVQCVVL